VTNADLNDLIELESRPLPADKKALEEKRDFDGERLEGLKKTIHGLVVWAVRIAGLSLIALFVLRMWHLGAPCAWVWLDNDRLQRIDTVLFSGFVGAFVTKYLQPAIPDKR